MFKERSPEEIYDDLVEKGMYEEANIDKDEIQKIKRLATEDYEYGKMLRSTKTPNWRVIFNIHYDSLRELCDLLMVFKKQKTSNHQGLFAFITINYPELELDWHFFDTIRKARNQNKYMGLDISKEMWKDVEFHMDVYIKSINKEIERLLKY
ncbi:MAG: hypothetical protein KJ601_01045 [Nanoarchaeota archaeon]|nr:hypothetical protein [Nanoarchaeota archaeon]